MKTRRILYTICFVLLCAVDWVNGSQDGRLQFVATNLTGVLFAVIICASAKFKEFLKPVYYVWGGIALIGAPVAIAIGLDSFHYPYPGKLITAVINICIYGFILIHTLAGALSSVKEKKIRWPYLAILLVMFLLMTVSPDKPAWPVWFAGMFGCFYLTTYDEKEWRNLAGGAIDGIIIAFVLIQGCTFLFRPYDDARYHGAYANTNINARFYLMVYGALLSKCVFLKKEERSSVLQILFLIFAGAMYGFLTLTGCRTALLAMFAVTFVYFICVFRDAKKKVSEVAKRVGILALAAIISVPIVYLPTRYLPTVLHHPLFFYAEYNEDKVHSYDPWNSEKYVSFGEMLSSNFGRIVSLIPFMQDVSYNQAEEEEEKNTHPEDVGRYILQTTEKLSTVKQREYIYRYYFKNLRITGHSVTEDGVPLSPRYHEDNAHNFIIQMSFWYGIPVGLGFLFFFVLCLLRFIKLVKEKNTDYACLFGCMLATFMVFGLFETVWGIGQLPFNLFFFLLYMVVNREPPKSAVATESVAAPESEKKQ